MQKQSKEMELLFTYSDVMEYVVSQCNLAMKDWDYEYIEEWLNDYNAGIVQEVVFGLIPLDRVYDANAELRALSIEMKKALDEIDDLCDELFANSFE